jgi:hypothetical protein
MAEPRGRRREAFDDVNALRGDGRRQPHDADHQRRADDPEGHAERAVDELRGETDGDERPQVDQIDAEQLHFRGRSLAGKHLDQGDRPIRDGKIPVWQPAPAPSDHLRR